MTLDISGFEEFQRDVEKFRQELDAIEEGLPGVVDRGGVDSADDLASLMRGEIERMGLVDSGKLLASVRYDMEMTAQSDNVAQFTVGPTVDYAKYVEYGTASHTITPKETTKSEIRRKVVNSRNSDNDGLSQELKDAPSLKFQGANGTTHALYVEHPGTDAKPFFRTSVKKFSMNNTFEENLEDELEKLFALHLT